VPLYIAQATRAARPPGYSHEALLRLKRASIVATMSEGRSGTLMSRAANPAAVAPARGHRRGTHLSVWHPVEHAPVGEPVLAIVTGCDAPVVAIQDEDRDWQVTWSLGAVI
jgi:hypothetical protein